jgi:hypothetical protein
VAATIIAVQVLGQVALHFELSIAQLLISLGVCAATEVTWTAISRREIAWPASALLTGNGIALILRVAGTQHGQWWSLKGALLFAVVGVGAVLSKYLLAWKRRPIFNPSNIALVAVFLVVGSRTANPQDLWWGPSSLGLWATYAVILVGGISLGIRLRLLPMALAFWLAFSGAIGATAASGHCMTARWQIGPVCGYSFWRVVVTSPEVLIFLLFMITDPRTIPDSGVGRVWFAICVAFLAALLVAPARSEFSTKVGILVALTLACAMRAAVQAGLFRRLSIALADPLGLVRHHAPVIGVALAAYALSLVAIGHSFRPAAVPALTVAERTSGALPPISYGSLVHTEDPSLSAPVAREMVGSLLVDLATENDALRARNPALAESAATGEELGRLKSAIERAPARSPGVVSGNSVRTATFVLVRGSDPQAPPSLAIRVTGAVNDLAYNRVFELSLVGSRYLISNS